jgi:peptidoglycan/xylan/chitin deacetylase (PgdA/CDA1 family)
VTKDKKYYFVIDPAFAFSEEVKWILAIFSTYSGVKIDYSSDNENSIYINEYQDATIRLSSDFFKRIYAENNGISNLPNNELNICFEDGSIDIFSTAFYFLNCLWELDPSCKRDHWGRSEFADSIWQKHGYKSPFTKVNQLFDLLAVKLNIEINKKKASVFLSHDIDVVYGACLQDGFAMLKKGRIFQVVKLLFEHLFRGPQWFNFRKIALLEKKFGMTSTFFWLSKRGKVLGIGWNADYNIRSKAIVKELNWLKEKGFSNGIHKSISSSTFQEEISELGIVPVANRYHYLKFSFDQLKNQMNDSGLQIDASLGYAQVMGYRNGYSLPFIPFDLVKRKPCSFLEVPLCIMDGTLSTYQKLSGEKAFDDIKEFLETHSQNSVISILWHNSHFTNYKYKGYPLVYKKCLEFSSQKKWKSISLNELIKTFVIDV